MNDKKLSEPSIEQTEVQQGEARYLARMKRKKEVIVKSIALVV